MYSVELLPDAALSAEVRRLWQLLADAGLPSLARHAHPTNRPHVTVGLTDDLVPVRAAVAGVVLPALPVGAVLAGTAVFAGQRRNTLVLELRSTPGLVALHERVWSVLASGSTAGASAQWSHLSPGAWRPHLSLALRLRPEQTDMALALLSSAQVGTAVTELRGSLVTARCYDTVTRGADELVL